MGRYCDIYLVITNFCLVITTFYLVIMTFYLVITTFKKKISLIGPFFFFWRDGYAYT